MTDPIPTPPSEADAPASPRLAFRLLGPGDEATLQAVFDAAPDHFLALTGVPPQPGAAAGEIAGAAPVPGREVALLVLRDTAEAVGAAGWWAGNPAPGVALLGTLLVLPAHRGRGLGREALEALEGWLAGRGVNRLRTAFPYRARSVPAVVQALGFRPMSIAEHARLGKAGAGTALYEKEIGG